MTAVVRQALKNPAGDAGEYEGPQKPDKLSAAALWIVGSTDTGHATRADFKHATLIAPLLLATSALAGVSMSLALHKFVGLTPGLAAVGGLCTSFLYAALDRTIIGVESRAKALRKAQKDMYPEKSTFMSFMGHAIAIGSRIAIAACFGLVVSKVIMTTQLYKHEISSVLEDRYQSQNARIIKYYDGQKLAYDKATSDLQTQLSDAEREWAKERQIARAADAEQFDNGLLQDAQKRLREQQQMRSQLEAEKAEQEKLKIAAMEKMAAEERGLEIRGSTGIKGRGPKWETASLEYQTADSSANAITARIETVDADIAAIRSELKALENRQVAKSSVMDENVTDTQRLVANLKAEIEKRLGERDQTFANFDRQMKSDPNHTKEEFGLLASLSALDELMEKPENQGTPKALYFALLFLLIGIETSPVIAAAMRPSTKAEMLAAYKEMMNNAEEEHASVHRLEVLRKALKEEIEHLGRNNIVARGEETADPGKKETVKVSAGYNNLAPK